MSREEEYQKLCVQYVNRWIFDPLRNVTIEQRCEHLRNCIAAWDATPGRNLQEKTEAGWKAVGVNKP